MKPILYALVACLWMAGPAYAQESLDAPISAADKRIKTFVYNESEVFVFPTRYGYQSNIEFSRNETIDTISVGQQFAWQIVPSGRRLFIRALTDNVRTNMTVITSKRSYQFDLRSTGSDDGDVVYVARFYYPEEESRVKGPDLTQPGPVMMPGPAAMAAPVTPVATGPSSSVSSSDLMASVPVSSDYNFKYSYTGPEGNASPVKIFDDGKATYFQFRNMQPNYVPSLLVVTPSGKEVPVSYKLSNGYAVANIVAPRFTIRDGKNIICVYNEGYVKP